MRLLSNQLIEDQKNKSEWLKQNLAILKPKMKNADNTSVAFRARELLSKISRVQFQINLS